MESLDRALHQEQYFERFTEQDQKKRKCAHCRISYMVHARQLSPRERAVILSHWKKALEHLQPWKRLHIFAMEVSFLVFSSGEFPYPHTHGKSIMLPETLVAQLVEAPSHASFQKTLLHELIHIYQRHYPAETATYLQFVLGVRIHTLQRPRPDQRANPDVNMIVYENSDGSLIQALYDPTKADTSDILDARDHPYEMMAYALANDLVKDGRTPPSNVTMKWMVANFQ